MSYSRGEITHLVMPHMQNILGDLFGGDLMALVDQAAAVAAIRHAGGPAVTRSIHRLDFHRSIPVGALVTCLATVDFVGNSSMDITVEVYSEQVSSGRREHTHSAHVVFVAWQGRPSVLRALGFDRRGIEHEEYRMKQNAILIVTSLLSILLLTLHVTDDIVRGISKASPQIQRCSSS